MLSRLHGVIATHSSDLDQASNLAKRLEIPLFSDEQGFFVKAPAIAIALVVAGDVLALRLYESTATASKRSRKPEQKHIISLSINPQSRDVKDRIRAGRKQPFARALGLHKSPDLKILDATAGLGRDAFVMHGLGATISLLERSTELHLLLQYAVKSLVQAQPEANTTLRLLPCQDAVDYLNNTANNYDVVYLDPMYPSTRSNALPKKEMQLLRELLPTPQDADTLLEPALAKSQRVVVKRPPHAPCLADMQPHHSIEAKRVRYDVYINLN
ncbi:MAG: class I SAM-dependent methyltransferase [Salinisphaeraceae bacterium]|nr:class I SAM-dependent methyltransferase [Salinisphaeraceae bacterium]